jgi:Aspartyl protease
MGDFNMQNKRQFLATSATLAAGLAMPTGLLAAPTVLLVKLAAGPRGQPLVDLTIDGNGPHRFMIDSGASNTVIDSDFAVQIGLPPREIGGRRLSLKGESATDFFMGKNTILGNGLRLGDVMFDGLSGLNQGHYVGVLPASFLTFLPCQLDLNAMELRYFLDGAAMDLTGFIKVQSSWFEERNGVKKVYVDAQMADKRLNCLIDTGAGPGLYIGSQFVRRHRLWANAEGGRTGLAIGANGQTLDIRVLRDQRVNVGPISFERAPVVLANPRAEDNLAELGIDAILGREFLRSVVLAFDRGQSLHFKDRRPSRPTPVPATP